MLVERGPDRVNPFSIPAIIPNLGAGWVSIELGTRGPLALASARRVPPRTWRSATELDAIRLGRADVMLCGGTEAAVCEVGIAGFGAMRALSRRNDDPERASRPFDAERDGFVMGEAGALLVLEELEHAKARGAKIYAEVAGYGLSSDAKHITDPDPTGPVTAFKMALGDAGVGTDEIDYINAHATSTPIGDSSETQMLKYALGEENAYKTPVSGTKGATGHCLGAAGAIEAIFTVLAIRDGKLPPTINYEVEDPTCDLDYVPNEARDADVKVASRTASASAVTTPASSSSASRTKPPSEIGSPPWSAGRLRLLRDADRLERRHRRASSSGSSAPRADAASCCTATTSSSRRSSARTRAAAIAT